LATREDILEAALPIFAAVGFRAATVRDLSTAAGVNIAAINYHFGSKQGLYDEVLPFAYSRLSVAPVPTLAGHASAADAMRAWVYWYVDRVIGQPSAMTGQLMMHELADPTPALDTLVSRGVQPVFDALRTMIEALSPTPLTDDGIARFALSVVGQCLIYRSGEALLQRLDGVPRRDAEAIAMHIANVSIAAVQHAAEVTA
jgi:AcrR family transcriptional regulator